MPTSFGGADDFGFKKNINFQETLRKMVEVTMARGVLLPFLEQLQQAIAQQQKGQTILVAAELLKRIRRYSQLIPTDVFAETEAMITALIKALSTTDETERRQAMLIVEQWHDSKPKVILDMPKFRHLVFNVTL